MILTELIGDSPGIAAVREQVARLVGRSADAGRLPPVLLQGETGTGRASSPVPSTAPARAAADRSST